MLRRLNSRTIEMSQMPISVYCAVLGAGFALNAFTAVCLLGLRRTPPHLHLAAVFGVVGFVYLEALLLIARVSVWSHLSGSSTLAAFIIGPALYLYVETMTQPSPFLARRSAIAYISALAFGLVVTVISVVVSGVDAPIVRMLVRDSALVVWSVAWVAAAILLVRRHNIAILNLFSSVEDKTLDWVRWTVIGAALLLAVDVSATVVHIATNTTLLPYGLETVWVTVWMAVFGLLALRQHATAAAPLPASLAPDCASGADDSASRWALGDERRSRIVSRLAALMATTSAYRDSELSLPVLASRLGVTTNHLSEAINQGLGLNFFDYVNRLRIEEACSELARRPEATVLEVAYEVGFNSRSTFNAAFKKWTGQTPSGFRKTSGTDGSPSSEPAKTQSHPTD